MVEELQIVGKQKGPMLDWSKMVDSSFLPTDLQGRLCAQCLSVTRKSRDLTSEA